MKRLIVLAAGAAMLVSSCGTYEGSGAYTGATFGNIMGSAIGGIAGGWRGHEIGRLAGTVGGAAVGAAIGKAQHRKAEERVERARQQRSRQDGDSRDRQNPSGFDPQMRGDDRISFASEDGSPLVIRNAGIYETTKDGALTRGEACQVVFEIANVGSTPVYNVFPMVGETTGNRHIHISPNLRVESIGPHQAIRYTATLQADRGLRNGEIEVQLGVAIGDNVLDSQTHFFSVPTRK